MARNTRKSPARNPRLNGTPEYYEQIASDYYTKAVALSDERKDAQAALTMSQAAFTMAQAALAAARNSK